MEEDYVVVVWEYGYHCDEFDIVKVIGPLTEEKCKKIRNQLCGTSESAEILKLTKGE